MTVCNMVELWVDKYLPTKSTVQDLTNVYLSPTYDFIIRKIVIEKFPWNTSHYRKLFIATENKLS